MKKKTNTNINSKIRLTGLWERQDKDGDLYFSGSISGGLKLYIFRCKEWEYGSKGPKYEAYFATPPAKSDEPDGDQMRTGATSSMEIDDWV